LVPSELRSIPARFEQLAAVYPQCEAIGSGTWMPTYAELNREADSIAADLFRRGGSTGGRIALLQKLDGPLIGSILGVLKAGRTVAVLNATDPLPRLRQSLAGIEPELLITDPATRSLAGEAAPPGLDVHCFQDRSASATGQRRIEPSTQNPAFLIQTSGSTGRPQWVMQTQPNVIDNVLRHAREMQVSPDDRVLLLASPSGSQALATIFSALLHGAAVCPFPIAEKGTIGLAEWIREQRITVYVSAASAFRHFLKTLDPADQFPLVRLVKVGAEAIMADDFALSLRHFPRGAYYFTYSSAEAGNITQLCMTSGMTADASLFHGRLPLGHAAAGITLLVKNEFGQPAKVGETGEIWVHSKHLSPGYWRNLPLTAERFIQEQDGSHWFRTGDLATVGPGASVYCIGRRDRIVKIQGHRVDMSEVEEALGRLSEIDEAAVASRTHPDGSLKLSAYIVVQSGLSSNASSVREKLRAHLPDYMIPSEIVFLDDLPLHPHGKIDREKLQEYTPTEDPQLEEKPFHIPAELFLANVWKDVFAKAAVGRESDFFEFGGDSLTAGVIAARVKAAFGVDLDMLDFVSCPAISALAARITSLQESPPSGALPPLLPAGAGPYPLSFTQESIWRHCQTPEAHRLYTVSRSYGFKGPLNVEALAVAMSHMVRRHEILRTTFPTIGNTPVQRVHQASPVELPLIDLSGLPDAQARAIGLLRDEARRPFDLDHGPLLRFTLVRVGEDEHWLLRVSHQILSDAWSWRMYFRELERAYESLLNGSTPPLDPDPLQHGDYAAWERRVFSDGPFRSGIVDWWRRILSYRPPVLPLPFVRSWVATAQASDGVMWDKLDPDRIARLEALASRENTTSYVVGMAAFGALLAAVSRQHDVTVGTHVTNRLNVALQGIQGNFARLVPVCLRVTPSLSFHQWLGSVQKQVVETQAHAQIPFEQLGNELRSKGVIPPEIQVIFGGPAPATRSGFAGLTFRTHAHSFKGLPVGQDHASMPWGMTLTLDLTNPERPCELTFDARIYDPQRVRSFFFAYLQLLDRVSEDANQTLESLTSSLRP
jgi:non-ribosomal peptide synthetase component F